MRRLLLPCLLSALAGCSVNTAPYDRSVQGSITSQLKDAAQPRPRPSATTVPVPEAVGNSLLPPLRIGVARSAAQQLAPRFDLVVTDAPISQVLMAIVTDTPYSILLSPRRPAPVPPMPVGLTGSAQASAVAGAAIPPTPEVLTVNLKDVTVFEALDAIREMYGYEYTLDGSRIYVQPPELRTKLYQVNYILGQRRGVSDLQVIGGASSSSNSTSGTSGTTASNSNSSSSAGSGSYASIQASGLSSISKSDVWGELEDAVRTVLGCHIARQQPGRSATGGGGAAGAAGTGVASSGGSTSSANSSRADVSFVGDSQLGERLRGVEGCSDGRALTVNQMSGTVLVRGLPRELRMIEGMLRSMQVSIARQVIIEAKVIDVELNSDSQQGINWAAFSQGLHRASVGANGGLIDGTAANRGVVVPGTSLADLLGTQLVGVAAPNAFSAGLGVALQFTNFSALINFLQTQGQVQVLSSPRIATLNNQKAVLKVGSEEPFVTNISGGSSVTSSGGTVITPPTLSYQPFFSGISLDVTPQIDDNDNITLHVHSMVNSIIEKEKISLPAANAARVPFAVNSISETDSVVKTRDGQVVVIGGLMTESASDNRSKVPGVGDAPGLGALFGRGARQSVKRELVILLKTTVVKGDETWATDINATQGRIEKMNATPPGRVGLQ